MVSHRYIAAAALLACSAEAIAQSIDPNEVRFCNEVSLVYDLAAEVRDSQGAPQAAYQLYRRSRPNLPDITDERAKRYINNVFFREDLAVIPANSMYAAVNTSCLNEKPKYTPLK